MMERKIQQHNDFSKNRKIEWMFHLFKGVENLVARMDILPHVLNTKSGRKTQKRENKLRKRN